MKKTKTLPKLSKAEIKKIVAKSKKPSKSKKPAVCSKDFVLTFGKYKGKKLEDIAEIDPYYVIWLSEDQILKIDDDFMEAVRSSDFVEDDDEIAEFGRRLLNE
jgi:hypothetical protein